MKKAFLILILIFHFSATQAQQQEELNKDRFQIEIQMENVMNDQGKILLGLYTEEGFTTQKPVLSGMAEIKDGHASFTFKDVPPGVYAIMALHDANENYRMDKQANGMPDEAWATSGNDLSMGPPSFEASKFTLEAEDLTVKLRF